MAAKEAESPNKVARSNDLIEGALLLGRSIPSALLDALDAVDPICILDRETSLSLRKSLCERPGALGVLTWLLEKERVSEPFLAHFLDRALPECPEGKDPVWDEGLARYGEKLIQAAFNAAAKDSSLAGDFLSWVKGRALMNKAFLVAAIGYERFCPRPLSSDYVTGKLQEWADYLASMPFGPTIIQHAIRASVALVKRAPELDTAKVEEALREDARMKHPDQVALFRTGVVRGLLDANTPLHPGADAARARL